MDGKLVDEKKLAMLKFISCIRKWQILSKSWQERHSGTQDKKREALVQWASESSVFLVQLLTLLVLLGKSGKNWKNKPVISLVQKSMRRNCVVNVYFSKRQVNASKHKGGREREGDKQRQRQRRGLCCVTFWFLFYYCIILMRYIVYFCFFQQWFRWCQACFSRTHNVKQGLPNWLSPEVARNTTNTVSLCAGSGM